MKTNTKIIVFTLSALILGIIGYKIFTSKISLKILPSSPNRLVSFEILKNKSIIYKNYIDLKEFDREKQNFKRNFVFEEYKLDVFVEENFIKFYLYKNGKIISKQQLIN